MNRWICSMRDRSEGHCHLFKAHRIRNRTTKQKDLLPSNYIPCKSFTIEYWKDFSSNSPTNPQKKPITNEKSRGKNSKWTRVIVCIRSIDIGMSIHCDDEGKFSINHWPPLPIDDSVIILQMLQKPTVTMEEVLNRTIFARCQRRFEVRLVAFSPSIEITFVSLGTERDHPVDYYRTE